MKKLLYSLATVALLGTAANAQVVSCNQYTAPEVINNMSIAEADVIGGSVWSSAPSLIWLNAGEVAFPTIEFLITKRGSGVASSAYSDHTIIGSSIDGIFYPTQMNRYGTTLVPGDTIRATAIGYDIVQIRHLVDSLLTGTNGMATCCAVVDLVSTGFCTTLEQSGIESGADINNLSQVLDVFDLFSSSELTINELTSSMSTVNSSASFLTGGCGGSLMPICYGIDADNHHMYSISAANNIPIAVQELSAVTNFAVFPNPASNGIVNIALETTQATDLQVNIYNVLGQRAITENLGTVLGQRSIIINTNELTAGVYMVELTDGTNKQASRLVIK